MFRVHKIWSNNLSVKNLVLLFFTIVLWFISVITLAQIDIPSSIDNAWQTIARITITASGTDSTPLIEMSSWGIHIDDTVLNDWGNFSGKILGIDENGDVIYVYSYNLVGSWTWGWWTGDGHWTGDNTGDIRNLNSGNVGIWTSIMSGKLHIKSSWDTDIYIEEQTPGMAASLRLLTPTRTWIAGWDSSPDIFFIGTIGHQEYFAMNSNGYVGIGTTWPKAKLQVSGIFIAWNYNNSIQNATDSSILWWKSNSLNWDQSTIWWGNNNKILSGRLSFIWWGIDNRIFHGATSFIWWWSNNSLTGNGLTICGGMNNKILGGRAANRAEMGLSTIWWGWHNEIYGGGAFIWWWQTNILTGHYVTIGWGHENRINWYLSFIGWGAKNIINWTWSFIGWGGRYNWEGNSISWANFSSIVWWTSNKIYTATNAFIGWGDSNVITWNSNYSTIPGWWDNIINNATYSFAAWVRAKANYNNSFVWNSDVAKDFSSVKPNTFIINALGGVWIGTENPQWDLNVAWNGLLVLKPLYTNTNGCSIQWAIHYNNKWSTTGGYLCYCDGEKRRQIQDNTLLCI